MPENSLGSTTLPRDFKYRPPLNLTTPEPTSASDPLQPSPPRQRLKLRRRIVSNLHAPTEQFLASVAAADFPLPTIEHPPISENPEQVDSYESKSFNFQRCSSSPKTPRPFLSLGKKKTRGENWVMGYQLENYSERPSSSHSNNSDVSHDSSYCYSRFGRSSENESCTSPESDCSDPFNFSLLKDNEKITDGNEIVEPNSTMLNASIRSKVRNDAPWSRAQTAHLWATYLLYLQDPTVTPFRIGASRVPPEGVCYRVAREARRSWKGPRSNQFRSPRVLSHCREKSESITPTEKSSQIYAQWPHSSSATRNNLRNLCRQRDPSATYRFHHYLQSRSPTPFSKPALCQSPRNSALGGQRNNFSIHDMSVSLSISTAVSMQPDGPLASLAQEESQQTSQSSTDLSMPLYHTEPRRGICSRACTLGSPFSRSYGPSFSKTNDQSDLPLSVNLRSPLHFDNPRTQIKVQKRRALCDLHEEIDSNPASNRPSIINKQSFSGRFGELRRFRNRGFSLGNESLATQALQSALHLAPPLPFSLTWSKGFQPETRTPPRLRSPFAESNTHNSFPCRYSTNSNMKCGSNSSSSSSMHQARRSIASFDFSEGRMSLHKEDNPQNAKTKPRKGE